MTSFLIITLNCQGMGTPEKRRDVFNDLKCKQFNIYCLQDTHFIDGIEPYVQSQWGYKCLFNSLTSNVWGVEFSPKVAQLSLEKGLIQSWHDNPGRVYIAIVHIQVMYCFVI